MRKYLLMVAVVMLTVMCAQAQKIKVVDSEGNAVPYASVLTPTGEYIGITNHDGELADMKGAKAVTVTHVAFKSKDVKVGGAEQVVTLEDADFGLGEITVAPKPLVYVQTYYRMYFYNANDGMIYYRVGLTDNAYDRSKKTVKASTNHVAKAKYGAIKVALGMFGGVLDRYSELKPGKLEETMKKGGEKIGLRIVDAGPGKKHITDFKGVVGSITDDVKDGLRRFSYNSTAIYNHKLEVAGDEKKLQKREKRAEKKKNKQESDFILYRIDEDGNYAPEDFVMRENIDNYDVEDDGKLVHEIIALQAFNTERAYVTKEELKQRKKDNKVKLTYENIMQFERQHNIPPLLPVVQEKLREVWKVDQ